VPEHAIIRSKTTTPYPGSRDGIIPDAYGRIVDPFVALARASAVTKNNQTRDRICSHPERTRCLLAKEVLRLDITLAAASSLASVRLAQRGDEIMGATLPTAGRRPVTPLWREGTVTKEEAEYHGTLLYFPPYGLSLSPRRSRTLPSSWRSDKMCSNG